MKEVIEEDSILEKCLNMSVESTGLDLAMMELSKTLAAKNASYGNAFEDDLNEYGLIALEIQAGHKLKRIKAMRNGNNTVHESMLDAVKDLAGYAVLAYSWLREVERNKRCQEG